MNEKISKVWDILNFFQTNNNNYLQLLTDNFV